MANEAPKNQQTTKSEAQTDQRLARPDRDAPHDDRRPGEGREFTNRDWEVANQPMDAERKRAFREKWMASHLPNLPKKDGWHRCWVASTHALDTVARRLALGYRVIQIDEIKDTKGWTPEQASAKDATSVDGSVRWREMVGMEVPEDQYQETMKYFHDELPKDMVRDIYQGLEQSAAEVREKGGRIDIGEGLAEMARFRRASRQFE